MTSYKASGEKPDIETKNITPVIIVGSARNGTTNLENAIASLPGITGIEHWLHHGSIESNIYTNHKRWGDLRNPDDYIRFVYKYASYDYFQLCGGDIEFHMDRKRDHFYDFFCDLMDYCTIKAGNKYWVTKLDPAFFLDDTERECFISLLKKRYPNFKIVQIKRDFKDAFISYRSMEGKKHKLRKNALMLLPALIYEASRYTLIYNTPLNIEEKQILHINFKEYISSRDTHLKKIAEFLGISLNNFEALETQRFRVNSSFTGSQKKELPKSISNLIPRLLKFFRMIPAIPKFIWKTYFNSPYNTTPFFNRLIKFRYYRDDLIQELTAQNSTDLVEKIKQKTRQSTEKIKIFNQEIAEKSNVQD